VPIYAIQPAGPFAAEVYARLREFLNGQINEGVERCCVPGVVAGQAVLLNGQVVPVIYPELRGMYSWDTNALVEAATGKAPAESAKAEEREAYRRRTETVRNFLERTYYEVRNLGLMPQERAINYAATNAANPAKVFEAAVKEGMELDSIEVERSPIGRPGADCWDVKMTFFNPSRRFEQARRVYRFCVDVSEPIPVTIGDVRSWHVY
jgi:cyanobactin maturation PatA/PatG family protease